jgi:hypothetical protein
VNTWGVGISHAGVTPVGEVRVSTATGTNLTHMQSIKGVGDESYSAPHLHMHVEYGKHFQHEKLSVQNRCFL